MRPTTKAQLARIKKTANVKRSLVVNSRRTCVSLENEFWRGLHQIAEQEHTTVAMLAAKIDRQRDTCNLSSAIRIFVFNYLVQRTRMFAE
jgi:predicted DNA-binding ribbon-helix-helix protein